MKELFMRKLAKDLTDFAENNKIAEIGEIVETSWSDWKKPHKVEIYDIHSAFTTKPGTADIIPTVCYSALRLNADGTYRDKLGCGIVLSNFQKKNGEQWEQIGETINHCGFSFSVKNPRFEQHKKDNKLYKSGWL